MKRLSASSPVKSSRVKKQQEYNAQVESIASKMLEGRMFQHPFVERLTDLVVTHKMNSNEVLKDIAKAVVRLSGKAKEDKVG